MTSLFLSAVLWAMSAFESARPLSPTDLMIVRAGCPSNPRLASIVDVHAKNKREASLVVMLYAVEGHCDERAEGDFDKLGRATSFGLGQQHGFAGEWAWLLDDLDAQVRTALMMLRQSLRACGRGDDGLSLYTRGKCNSERGRELSRVRMKLARRIGEWK